jgi:hypothetical protein
LTAAEDANSANSNPDGVWSLLAGTAVLPFNASISAGCTGGAGLTGYYSTGGYPCPASFFVATGAGSAWAAGDVLVYSSDFGTGPAQAFVDWTAPAAGTITINGYIWYASSGNRSDNYILALNGTMLATGGVTSGDGTSRANPATFNGGGTLSVNAGDVVSLEIFNPTGASEDGSFAGIDLSITETSVPNTPPIAVPALSTWGLIGLAGIMFLFAVWKLIARRTT